MLTIMVVDDHEPTLAITKVLLKKSGYIAETFINGADALERILKNTPDIIISDVHMPVMDGFTLCRKVKKDDRLKHIPFIFVSSIFVDSSDRKLGLSLGGEAFILKTQKADVFLGELQDIIQKCINTNHKVSMPDIIDEKFNEDYIIALNRKLHEKIIFLKEANQRLSESTEYHRLIVETANEGFITLDNSFRITFVNSMMVKMISYSSEEMIGQKIEKLLFPEDLPAHQRKIENRKEVNKKYEQRLRCKDGSGIWTLISPKSLFDKNGDFISIMAMLTDITEQKNMEAKHLEYKQRIQQSQKMEAIGTLAGGIAHDFNNILFPLIGFAEILKNDLPSDSRQQGYIDQILKAGFRSRDLVRQILTFSRQNSQDIRPTKLQHIIKEALKLIRSSIPTTIDIIQNIEPDCSAVNADPSQIHQIIMNLATNAFHAMEDAGGKLTVTLKQIELEKGEIFSPEFSSRNIAFLKFEDTGTGIKKEILDKIFDPYFTTKEKNKGTGLGLSVVQGIVKSHNGEIQAYSEPGMGTEIHIYFPVLEEVTEKLNTETCQSIPGGTESILLVDDEKEIAKMIQLILDKIGYKTTVCTDSNKALETFKAHPDSFDLILSDLTMPHMTGIQLSKKIRRERPNIPIIISTGFRNKINDKEMREIGIQGIINKPALREDIAKIIRKTLDESSQSKQS